MNAIRHSLSQTVGGDCEWLSVAYLGNADGSSTDSFCFRLGFVFPTKSLRHLWGDSHRKLFFPSTRGGRKSLLVGE